MQKVAILNSISKQYLNVKQNMRRHKTLFSSLKLIIVGVVFLFVLGVYAKEINE
ncbi:MAG: hypothetical protein H6765_07780 [Candidatus Peribacteria bacterium]|nr:MAG: hypothetical protein H6765_07780 [Candidatus Peribacteria bacterium]